MAGWLRSSVRLAGIGAILPMAAAQASVVHVDDDAPPGGDGATWASAFDSLQDALAAAVPGTEIDEIWVAEGTYRPGPPGETDATFQLISGVGLYAGFTGNETQRDQRDWQAHLTILSGDLAGDDVYGDPVWYLGWNIGTPNAAHVVTAVSVDATAVLDGFTLIGGHVTHGAGGGMYVDHASPAIVNCTFTRNLAGFNHGGGMAIIDGSPSLQDCTFLQNWVHLGHGGGLYIYGDSSPFIEASAFLENRCTGATPEAAGGGIATESTGVVTITRCRFQYNSAQSFYPSGGTYGAYGGGLYNFLGAVKVTDSIFRNNTSNAGGGLWTWGDATVINSLFTDNAAPEYHGSSGGWGGIGGAIGSSSFAGNLVTIVGTTVEGNTAEAGAGIRIINNAQAAVSGSVLWNNSDRFGTIGTAQIRGAGASYSCIQNMLIGEPGEDPPDPADFPGCIDDNPMFIDAALGDFHLSSISPCIDAADNTAFPPGVTTDLDGLPRFVDDPLTPDTGVGGAPMVDMGSFEFQAGGPCPGDVNGDGSVGFADLVDVLSAWGPCPGGCPQDLDGSEVVGFSDLIILLAAWGDCP